MRAGEIIGLRPTDVSGSVARLRKTKTNVPRSVPLSKAALALLDELPASDPLFGLTSRQLDAVWRAIMKRAAIDGLIFHDSRHEAVSRLVRKHDMLALARMIGHRDIKMLMVYYNERAQDIAARLG